MAKIARKTLFAHMRDLRLARETEDAITAARIFPKPRPEGAFATYPEAVAARQRADAIAGTRTRYVTNEGGWWTIQQHGRAREMDRVHRPGSMGGALKAGGMAAAWMVWIDIEPTEFWSAEAQIRHRDSAYSGSVAAGIVWW